MRICMTVQVGDFNPASAIGHDRAACPSVEPFSAGFGTVTAAA